MSTHFIKVDLVIEGNEDLTPLAEEPGEEVAVLYCGRIDSYHRTTLELARESSDPDDMIQQFCHLITRLESKSASLWNTALCKIFDIGYESSPYSDSFSSDIQAQTVKEIAKIGASIRVTVYMRTKEEHDE